MFELTNASGEDYEERSETDLFIKNFTKLMSSEHFGYAAFSHKSVYPDEISSKLKETIYGQDNAIDQIAYKITLNKMRKESKLLTIALLGPTGTGKSETARRLSNILTELYGTKYGFIEVSANEYFSDVSVSRFFGAPPSYVGYGKKTVLDPVRNNPYHVIVINEVEKAADTFMTGLMEAIDTGMLGMADNSDPIDLNKCIMIFTSNIPIDRRVYETADDFERSEMCRDAFTKHCKRPEISGKIGNFIIFMPLSDKARAAIVIKFIKQELDSFDLTLTYIDRSLLQSMLTHESKYGARGIQNLVCDSIGRELLNKRMVRNDRTRYVKMSGTINNIRLEIA